LAAIKAAMTQFIHYVHRLLARRRPIIFLLLLFIQPLAGIAQYKTDYVPLGQSGSVPSNFLVDPIVKTKQNMAQNTVLEEKQAFAFYSKVNFLEQQLFQGGQIYLSNSLTNTVDSIVNRLLITDPTLSGKINVFVSRFTEPNAYCFPDGTIIFNLGLIELLEDESELAFILAHEIGHFAEGHSVKDLKRLTDIEKRESNHNNQESSAYRGLQFSRDSEFDADFWALQLVHQAGYDLNSAINALTRLKGLSSSAASTLDLATIFNSEYFTVDTSWVNEKALKRFKNKFSRNDDSRIASGKVDDIFQTHPDIDKRVEALTAMAKTLSKGTDRGETRGKRNVGHLKGLAEFEMIENCMRKQNYLETLERALKLLKTYPDNAYLHTAIARSLYWISYYKEINNGDVTVNRSKEGSSADLHALLALFNSMGLADTKKLAYSYAKLLTEKDEMNEPYLFYLALSTENYLGKNLAKVHYQEYLIKHPKGSHINLVKSRIQ